MSLSTHALRLRHILAVAPMLDCTDSHCRTFHRLLSRDALLYTEMYTTNHLLHGDAKAILSFDRQTQGHVVAQLGGSDYRQLAQCARACEDAGYCEVNLNCGCPSEATQKGCFGAVLMANPSHVATCVRAMAEACGIPVTVKHRLGLGYSEDYSFVRDFVGQVSDAGARVVVAHARNAILGGLSPRQNRRLRHDVVYQLKRDFPGLVVVVNGGVTQAQQVQQHLASVDGVMIGRAAYDSPWFLTEWDGIIRHAADSLAASSTALSPSPPSSSSASVSASVSASASTSASPPHHPPPTKDSIEDAMVAYMIQQMLCRPPPFHWKSIARHMLGLRNGSTVLGIGAGCGVTPRCAT